MIEPATLAPETLVALIAAQGGRASTAIVRTSFPPQGAAHDAQAGGDQTPNALTGARPDSLLDFSLVSVLQGQEPDTETDSQNTFANPHLAKEDDQDADEDSGELTGAELRKIAELQAIDREVRNHERAHQTAGGNLTGQAVFEFTTGPDGRRYAVSGEVPIDATPEDNPEETIRKLEQVKRAANAPAQPSAQDRAVVAQADADQAQARAELADIDRTERAELRRQQADATDNDAVDQDDDNDNDEDVQLEQLGRDQDPQVELASANDNGQPETEAEDNRDRGFVADSSSFSPGSGFSDAPDGAGVTAASNRAFGAADPFEPVETFSGIVV